MISIIVSTYQPDNFAKFEQNLKDTIGEDIDYEIIKIDNPALMGLCEAYNKGIEKAQYPYLCFSHDDILISSHGWAKRIIEIFEENGDYGMIGVAGSTYKSWSPSGWFFPDDSKFPRMDIIHADDRNLTNTEKCLKNPPSGKDIAEVVVLDGCWFCTTAKVAAEFKFDEKTLTGYHCYDLDYSFQVGSKYKLGVVYNMELIHYSMGAYSRDWVNETYILHKKWSRYLPLMLANLSKEEIADNEFKAFSFTLEKALSNKASLTPMVKLLFTKKIMKLVGMKKWFTLQKWTMAAIIRSIRS